MSTAERARGAGARIELLVAVALVLVVGALYVQTRQHGFVSFDDGSYIAKNPHVNSGLSLENARWAFSEFHSANWHPLTWLSHQLDVQLFALAAGPHHLMSGALHALNAVLCFLFLRRATGSLWASALVALLFAVHPQRVESVAWAAERKDVLCATFFFLTLLAYLRYARAPSRGRHALALGCFALGLLAKPMLVTLPLVLVLLDLWPLAQTPPRPLRARVLEKLPFLALALASALVTLYAQRAGNAVRSIEVLPLDARVATAVLGTFAYVGKAFWPLELAFFYPHPAFVTPQEFAPLGTRVWLAAVALVALTYGAWRLRARAPALFVGWSWMGLMLAPVIGLVQVGSQFYADRYAYLPLLGLTIALVFGLRELVRAVALQRALFALGLVAGAACATLTYRQVGTWKDDPTLYARALEVTERNYVAHQNLGMYLQGRGELVGAREHYQAALAIVPDLYSAHGNLGALYAQQGQRELAVAEFREALRLVPDFLDARLSWGLLLEREGDLAAALEHYQRAVREHPESAEAWRQCGGVLLTLGRLAEARTAFERALEREPGSAEAECDLGSALDELGDARAALAHFSAAQRRAPELARALHGEAWLRATRAGELRDPARAAALLQRCAARDGAHWTHQRVQAAVLAAQGQFKQAAAAQAEAFAAAPRAQWERLKAELASYQAGRALER
ncbi:MAG: tetratricopeptide repeat protein [Planctomycetes bacterium]|nr:tetratricopeptide repeat protein [Planctomycetota bacterium]